MARTRSKQEQNTRADTMGTTVYSAKDNQSLHNSLNGEFILYQILLQQILDGKNLVKFEQSSLLNYFEPKDTNDQKLMKEFDQDYQSNKAIHWYRRESCVYKILNKALRTQNIDDIIPFGHFIRDLDKQLSSEHKKYVQQQNISSIQVYRGQLISSDELNRLKTTIGELISMNSFLSTSTNKEKAIKFASNRPSDELTSILLEINVNLKALTRPYADIKHLSAFSDEEEILFMFGCIFRLEQIYYDEKNQIWTACLSLCSHDDEDMTQFASNLENQLKGQNQLIAIGTYLIQMMKYEQAEEHYQKILRNHLTDNPIELAYCHHGLAQVNQKKGDHRSAIDNLIKALDYLLENSKEKNHPLIAQSYNDLAKVYTLENDYILAFQFYGKALKTINNIPSTTYSGLSLIHFQLQNYNLAIEYLQKALQTQPSTAHALIANTYIEMGKIYAKVNDKEKASEMFDKAIEYQSKMLGKKHPDLGYTYSAIGMMYSDMGDQEKALEYIDKAYQLQLETLPNSHSDFADTYRNFGDIYLKKEDIDKALSYYHKSLENQSKTLLWNHPLVVITYSTIGHAHRMKKDYKQALVYFHKALDSELTRKKVGDPSLSSSYKNLAEIYTEKGDLDEALDFYLKYLANELETKLDEDMSLSDTYKTIAGIYYKKRCLSQSLLYCNRLLDCYLQKKPIDESNVEEVYAMIGKIYLKKSHISDTLLYYDKLNDKSTTTTTTKKFEDIDNIYFEKRHLDHVLNYFEDYLQEQLQRHSSKSSSLADTYRLLGNICLEKRDLDQALKYFLKLLDNKLHRRLPEDPSLSEIYEMIATIYLEKQNYHQVLIYFNRFLDCHLLVKSFNHPLIKHVYQIIGEIYLKKDPFDQIASNDLNTNLKSTTKTRHVERAIIYFHNLLIKQIAKHSSKDFQLEQIYSILGNLFLEKQNTNQALFYYHQLLHYQYRQHPYAYLLLGQTYEIIARIYSKQHNYNQALQHYQQTLVLYKQIYSSKHHLVRNIKYKIYQLILPHL